MSNKTKMSAIAAQIKVMESKIAAAKAKKAMAESRKTGIAYLIESELEKAEVLLVAKSVIDKLQKTAEDLAKIDGTDIMPAMEGLKVAFGPEEAQAFQQAAADQLRAAVNAVSAAKDAIGQHVAKFEGVLNGEGSNDMATMGMDDATPADAAPEVGAPDDLGAEAVPADDAAMDGEADLGDAPAPTEGDDADMAELDGMFDDVGTDTAAGRPKKESATVRLTSGAKALAESKNPDALILSSFRRVLAESGKPVPAAKAVSRHFGIDVQDVVAIVKETRLGK